MQEPAGPASGLFFEVLDQRVSAFEWSVVVAVVAVWVVQVVADPVVHVVAVGDPEVAAGGGMDVAFVVIGAAACMCGRAAVRVHCVDRDHVVVHVVIVAVVEVAVVQVVDVVPVDHTGVVAARPVLMRVAPVRSAHWHA